MNEIWSIQMWNAFLNIFTAKVEKYI